MEKEGVFMELRIVQEDHLEIHIHKSLTNSRSVHDYSSLEAHLLKFT